MKIIILGSGGFVGSALVRKFREKHVEFLGLQTSSKGPRLDDDHQWITGGALKGADVVYLTAGRTGGVGRMARDPLSFVLPNVRIQMNVMQACLEAGVKRLVTLQSTTGYPDTPEPVREDQYLDGNVHPAYFAPGTTWRFVENLSKMFRGLEIVFLRPSNVYGPGNDFDPTTSHVIEATVRKVYERQDPFVVWGDGTETRDATYIDDLAEAMTRCLDCPPGAYNIGTGMTVSVRTMIDILLGLARWRTPRIVYDGRKPTAIPTRRLDCSKAREVLGWQAKVGIDAGLARTYEWFAGQMRPA